MGEFFVQVVRLGALDRHPNADSLSVTKVHGDYPVVVKTGSFKEGDLAVYVPVDAVVPATEEWAWLRASGAELRPSDRRIKAKRLRGVFSMGLLHPAPEGAKEGDDVAEKMGITRFDDEADAPRNAPQKPTTLWQRFVAFIYGLLFPHTKQASDRFRPRGLKHLPGVYDIEPFRRYGRDTFRDGEVVVVTEKLHGQNASYVSDGKRLFCKSRTRWRDVEDDNSWANVARRYDLEWKLSKRPFVLLFGETYGNNADMAYGVDKTKEGSDRFAAFDAYDTKKGQWLNHFEFENFCNELDIPMAPRLATIQWGPDSYEYLLPFAEGETTMRGAKHVREGFVVKAANERPAGLPRAILKLAGEGYHTRKAAA
jgi:tRNA-binding EMAP/Myf-like protein